MSEQVETQIITGSAQEIGEAVFLHVCLPVLYGASERMPPDDAAQLYMGLITAAYGMLVELYGQDNADALLTRTVDALWQVRNEAASAPLH